jgi:hypothetical protein
MGVRRWERRGPEKVCVISSRTSSESGTLTVTLTDTQSGLVSLCRFLTVIDWERELSCVSPSSHSTP